MPTKRTYGDLGDACRAANALDLVGDRWTLIVVREVILGPKRFTDLQESVRGITPAVLTDRLRSLRESGIIEQIVLPDLARTARLRRDGLGPRVGIGPGIVGALVFRRP